MHSVEQLDVLNILHFNLRVQRKYVQKYHGKKRIYEKRAQYQKQFHTSSVNGQLLLKNQGLFNEGKEDLTARDPDYLTSSVCI